MKLLKISYLPLAIALAIFGFFTGLYYAAQIIILGQGIGGILAGMQAMLVVGAILGSTIGGFVLGLVAALIYNVLIAKVKPLEIELK